jgi:hypothetical protein
MRLEDSLNELAQWGSPVDLAVATTESDCCKLEIEQSGESRVFELENRRIAYLLDVCLTNQSSSSMYIADLELRVPWEEEIFEWLSPKTITVKDRKRQKNASYQQYRFSGKNGLELPTTEVINHFLTFGKRLFPRRPLSGYLLATGGFMPQQLFHGGWVDLTLIITTTDHAEYSKTIRVLTERLERRTQHSVRKSNLFGDKLQSRTVNESQLHNHELSKGQGIHNHRAPGEQPRARISGASKSR